MNKQKKAFTLVELIVVIIILAILGTIAFIAMQGYSQEARDSARISDISKIRSSLELFYVDSGSYPDPTEAQPVTYSGGLAWYQGIFGNSTFMNVEKLDKIPTDPLTDKEYVYSVVNTKQEYQLAGIIESNETSLNNINSGDLYAADKIARAIIRGNYNEISLRVNENNTSYILAVPSIISSQSLDTDNNRKLENIISSKELVIDNYRNLPNNYIGSNYAYNKETTDSDFSLVNNLLVYEGNIESLSSTDFVDFLQQAYSGTTVSKLPSSSELFGISLDNPSDLEKADTYGVSFLNTHLGGAVSNKIYATCGSIAHNTTKTYYSAPSVDFGLTCDSVGIDFTCIDGSWIDQITSQNIANYPETECAVALPLSCEYLGMPLDHGDTLTVYSIDNILWNATQNCTDGGIQGEVICNNGVLEGNNTYQHLTCIKGTPSNCDSDENYLVGSHTYNIAPLEHTGTSAINIDIPENNGIFRYTFNALCNDGTITGNETGPENISCNSNYTLNEITQICEADTRTFTCGANVTNSSRNTVSSYEQTWSGTEWLPLNSNPTYNLTSSTTECRYICDTGYYWNGSLCLSQWSGDATTGYLYKNISGVEVYPTSCNNLLTNSIFKNTYPGSPWNGTNFSNGVYWIKPDSNSAFKVYCDMTGQGGGWTLLSNAVSYDGTGLFSSGNSCQNINQNCGGDLSKLGISTLGYNKVKIVHKDGKYAIIELKSGGNFEKAFKGTQVFVGTLDSTYIFEDSIFSRAGYTDNLLYRGINNSNDTMWLANNSYNISNWGTYAYKWQTNCPNIGYSFSAGVCGNSGGFSIYVKKETIVLGTISNPGRSCKEIKASGTDTGDGVYRIKPDSNPAFQVYCDMTMDGGGWTLVRKMKSDTIVSGSTSANNVSSLVDLTTASANLSDATWNAIKPIQVLNVCNGYKTIYNRNMGVAWVAYGVPNSCNYNTGFWTSLQSDFGASLYSQTLNQSCGGASNVDASARGVLSGIYSTTHYGCYDGMRNTQLTSIVASKYNNGSSNPTGWGGNGYVFVR